MAEAATGQITAAHDAVVALIRTIPDAALGWQPDGDAWSLKRIIAHIAHAYDFYLTIVEEARATDFGTVTLRPGLPGWQRVVATDTTVLQCATVAKVLDQLDAVYQRSLDIFAHLTPDELDRTFVMASWRADREAETTTLRRRVLETAPSHLREHEAQLAETLEGWRAASGGVD
jgi:hypothetical protein